MAMIDTPDRDKALEAARKMHRLSPTPQQWEIDRRKDLVNETADLILTAKAEEAERPPAFDLRSPGLRDYSKERAALLRGQMGGK